MNDDHSLDVFWHALNYRTAATQHAQDAWTELEACVERIKAAERERIIDAIREQTHPIACELYGATREQAEQWAKLDKYDSCADRADDILDIVVKAIRALPPTEPAD